jgi:hypothetical protein
MLTIAVTALCALGQPTLEADVGSRNRARYELGSGLSFSFADGKHEVGLGGFIQPSWAIQDVEGEFDQFLRARRTFLNLGGEFFDERLGFFFQVDFTLPEPLLDAWLRYSPWEWLDLQLGQVLTPTNNREQLHMESDLSFVQRSLLSRTFSESGREFGAYMALDIPVGGMLVRPMLSITSGDGRNSFGEDSRDRDVGGLKYGGRLDFLPFGDFMERNRGTVPDLCHEKTPKLVLGGAISRNSGASGPNGAGHDEFSLFDQFGDRNQPDYVLVYGDLLAKWQGVSLLFEFANASATSLEGSFTNESATTLLLPTEIASFLRLGNAINAQVGYVFDFGLSVDARYTQLFQEFGTDASLLQDTQAFGGGLAYYFFDHALKAQLNYERVGADGSPDIDTGEFILQVIL